MPPLSLGVVCFGGGSFAGASSASAAPPGPSLAFSTISIAALRHGAEPAGLFTTVEVKNSIASAAASSDSREKALARTPATAECRIIVGQ